MRYLAPFVLKDLEKKMVFIGGPRQCGKTTFAKAILEKNPGLYLNWDSRNQRKQILSEDWSDSEQLLVFDEIHKYQKWKNLVKGIYDVHRQAHRILVTGSARLDLYRRGGDSLQGRYHYWRLHPFTLTEIPKGFSRKEAFVRLMKVGGFPEPFFDGDERESNRWNSERLTRVFREDVRDLENVQDLSSMELFIDALRGRVGGPVVLNNIATDLEKSPKTLARWLDLLERMYLIFIVRPLTQNLPRAVKKPPKVYFFNNGDVEGDQGARFENFVATHLLKKINFLEDYTGDRYELRYIRDKEKREVDFAIIKNKKVHELYEVKLSDQKPSASLMYYSERLNPLKSTQIISSEVKAQKKGKFLLTSAIDCFNENWFFEK